MEDENNTEARLTFEETLSRLEAERRLDPAVTKTANYLLAASLLNEEQDVLEEARKKLQREDPRQLFYNFLRDSVEFLKSAEPGHQYRYARQLDDVAIAGLGIWQEDLGISAAGGSALRVTGEPNWSHIRDHINKTVFGDYFIEEIQVPNDVTLWGNEFPLRMSACDASQHRFKLKVPFNKTWATPVIVNNSGGTIKERHENQKPTWKHVAVPKDTKEYESWVIVGPDDYAEMDEGDYEWAAKSSMDVGQFFVEETFIFRHGGLTLKPDVHFRDGRIFPQDKLMNCKLDNRHGQLTREAIYRMVTACRTAKDLDILYCGVAKQVNLKVFSTIIDWYITKVMGKEDWNPTHHVVSDTEMIRNILFHRDFTAETFNRIFITCSVLRRFETTSNLNRRTRRQAKLDLESLGGVFQSRGISAKDIAEEALKLGVIMFFAGHTKTNELYIPRYEFAVPVGDQSYTSRDRLLKVLSALRLASFDVDEDHLWGLEEPIKTLIPTPILVAHDISKKMGEELASNFAQRTTAEFIKQLRARRGVG